LGRVTAGENGGEPDRLAEQSDQCEDVDGATEQVAGQPMADSRSAMFWVAAPASIRPNRPPR
jgi:hypothetical protein